MKEFRCRLLGTAPGIPVLGGVHSSVYVAVNGKKLLFDCGEGASQQLLRYGLSGDVLDAVAITHYHSDHTTGIFMVLQMLYLQNRTKPLYLFLPERAADFAKIMDMLYLFPERFKFELLIGSVNAISETFPEVTPYANNHLNGYSEYIEENGLENKMASYSLLAEHEDKSLLYSSDIYDSLSQTVGEVDYLILDALHPPLDELLCLMGKTRIKVILTHGLSDELQKAMKDIPQEKYLIAQDGLEINLLG